MINKKPLILFILMATVCFLSSCGSTPQIPKALVKFPDDSCYKYFYKTECVQRQGYILIRNHLDSDSCSYLQYIVTRRGGNYYGKTLSNSYQLIKPSDSSYNKQGLTYNTVLKLCSIIDSFGISEAFWNCDNGIVFVKYLDDKNNLTIIKRP